MLTKMFIQNYAIIEELSMNFGDKLNIITGETGAGKSILTGALGLIQGNRADTKVLYDTDKKCIVEAEFDMDSKGIRRLFKSEDIDFEKPVIIRRSIAPSGKSRAFVNDEPVKLSFLKELSTILVDMHRQFDTIGINDEATQIDMLDSFAKTQLAVEKYQGIYQEYRQQKNALQKRLDEESKVKQELDFLEFQFGELDEAAFLEDEQNTLENEVNVLQNADSIIQILSKTNYLLEESDNSIVAQLSELRNEMERLGDVGSDMEGLLHRMINAEEELRDLAHQASNASESIDADPAKLEQRQERLNVLYRLLQKHNKEDLHELLQFQEELHSKIKEYRSFGEDRTNLEASIQKLHSELKLQAKAISDKRQKHIPAFEKKIQSLLVDLGMEHAQFVVDCSDSNELRLWGTDNIQFRFSANPGKAAQALQEVASGGELSRLALSLKSVVAGNMQLGTLIFDEIDTGISGEVSSKMGSILKQLADKHQLISITHSPQIAAKADTHFFIYKLVENQRTYTKVKELDKSGRIIEIAKMLSGDPPSENAKKNAIELIG